MRPNLLFSILGVMMVALCAKAELWPDPPDSSSPPAPISDSKNSTLTFSQFKAKYNKKYSSLAQETYRKMVFLQNQEECNKHNNDPQRKYDMGPNFFMDMTNDQFQFVYTTVYPSDQQSQALSRQLTGDQRCWKKDCPDQLPQDTPQPTHPEGPGSPPPSTPNALDSETTVSGTINPIENGGPARRLQPLTINASILGILTNAQGKSITPPADSTSQSQNKSDIQGIYIDWSSYSGPVRFQGYCGACYAFATVDTVSSHLAIYNYGFFHQLSVQQIVDCADNGLTFGCYGGYLQGSLTHFITNGVMSERAYPFSSGDKGFSNKCKDKNGSFKIKSFQPLQQGSCATVIKSLYDGPISAGISGYKLRFYSSGIFNECSTTDRLDHAVMIIGYRSKYGWRIKNSWGTDWGEQGFGWIGQGNTCWICNMTVAVSV